VTGARESDEARGHEPDHRELKKDLDKTRSAGLWRPKGARRG